MQLRGMAGRARRVARRQARLARLRRSDPRAAELIGVVRQDGTTLLDLDALIDLYEAVRQASNLPGVIIEAGCARGGSALVLSHARGMHRRLDLYDVFGLIPPPSDADGADVRERYEEILAGRAAGPTKGSSYYGYETDLLGSVRDRFRAEGMPVESSRVRLIEGRFEDTMHIDEPVALAHVDCDWYNSVMTCLERIVPWLSLGGELIIDDYDAWSGARAAVDDFFGDNRDEFDFTRKARLHIRRVGGRQ